VKGLFLCGNCAGIHGKFASEIQRIKAVETTNWDDEKLKVTK